MLNGLIFRKRSVCSRCFQRCSSGGAGVAVSNSWSLTTSGRVSSLVLTKPDGCQCPSEETCCSFTSTFTSLYTICVVEWCTPTQVAVDGVSTRFVECRGYVGTRRQPVWRVLWLVSVSVSRWVAPGHVLCLGVPPHFNMSHDNIAMSARA